MKKELNILPGNMVDEMDVARLLCLSVRTLPDFDSCFFNVCNLLKINIV